MALLQREHPAVTSVELSELCSLHTPGRQRNAVREIDPVEGKGFVEAHHCDPRIRYVLEDSVDVLDWLVEIWCLVASAEVDALLPPAEDQHCYADERDE